MHAVNRLHRLAMPMLVFGGLWAFGNLLMEAASSPSAPLQSERCLRRAFSDRDYRLASDSLEASQGRTPMPEGYPELLGASKDVRVGSSCVRVVTLNWDGELAGGVVVFDRTGRVLWSDDGYHGARDVLGAGRDRVVFTYTTSKGSGVYESRFVALCALRLDAWVECFDAVAHSLEIVAGSGSGEPCDSDLLMERTASISVHGDTVLWRGRAKYRRHGDRHTREVPMGVARTSLPN